MSTSWTFSIATWT